MDIRENVAQITRQLLGDRCKDWVEIRERYLRDGVSIRLGGLAANLRRIKSFASRDANRVAVMSLVDESKHFIEWTAMETGIDTAAELVELQIMLAYWQLKWESFWEDPIQRNQLAEQSQIWSDRILNLSGLLQA
ncbi:MAG: hypothetical protein HYU64_06710 [Armatimonadetes bacterium]|nr:hypothetical protein [Armatimonadota bacterium]